MLNPGHNQAEFTPGPARPGRPPRRKSVSADLVSLWKPFQIKYQAVLLIEGNSEEQTLFPAYQRSWAAASVHRLQENTQKFSRRSKHTPASSQDLLLDS